MASDDSDLTLHARPWTAAIVLATAAFFALLIVGGGTAIALRNHPDIIWGSSAAAWALGSATVFRLQARLTATGIEARNAFRSYSATWSQISTIRVIPAVWYSSDFSWAASMLEVQTFGGDRFVVRVATHLSRAQVEALTDLLRRHARENGFDVPASLLALWKVNAG